MATNPFVYKTQSLATVKVNSKAPYKGLNTVDAISEMDPNYALNLTNFIASPQGCAPRQGYRKWSTGFTTPVTSILTYNDKDSNANKLFAVSGDSIYDITNGGTLGTAVVSGLNTSNTYWQQAKQTYSTSGDNYLMIVNGADAPLLYNGTTWTTCSQPTTPSGIGQFNQTDNNGNAVDITKFIDVTLHYQRLWFVKENSSKAYFAPVAAVGGQLSAFDFGPFFRNGGALQKLDTWTMDTGSIDGTSAMLVAISTKGDIVIYKGNDPSSSTNWSLVGTYQVGSPVGRRCTAQYQGDLMILSQDGLYPLSKYLQSARLDSTAALTYTISPTISALVSSLSTIPGFELLVAPTENLMLLNIPQLSVASNFQFCFHTITKGWSQFTGWAAYCFGYFNDQVYMGCDDHVGLCFIGYKDGADIDGTNGDSITCTALTAFNSMSDQITSGTVKTVKLVKPYLTTGQTNPTLSVGINVDFDLTAITGTATLSPIVGGVWDGATWGSANAVWNGSLTTYNDWITPSCYPGEYIAFAMSLSVSTDTLWSATSYIIQPANQIG